MNLNYNKMNALKFQNIREKRQECFNVDEYTFNDFDFDGKRRKVYSNVNLSIFTDDYCNANRETMDYDERAMRNHDKMAYLKENKVYLNDIWKCIDKDNRFTPIKQLLGYYYYVEVYKYQNIDMVSESANLVKLYEQKQIANDVVFEMIFHPNGNLNGSWVDDEDILLAYNPYKS